MEKLIECLKIGLAVVVLVASVAYMWVQAGEQECQVCAFEGLKR